MATYKIADVLNSIQSMQEDGYEYINIYEAAPDDSDDDDSATVLFVEAIEDVSTSETDMIDSVTLPDDYSCQL